MTTHTYPLGTIVQVELDQDLPGLEEPIQVSLKGRCTLYVVGHARDVDGLPTYVVSDLPVQFPTSGDFTHPDRLLYRAHANVVEHGLYGHELQVTRFPVKKLHGSIEEWLAPT